MKNKWYIIMLKEDGDDNESVEIVSGKNSVKATDKAEASFRKEHTIADDTEVSIGYVFCCGKARPRISSSPSA